MSPSNNAPLPIVDLTDPKAAQSIRNACLDHGFFYVTKHGVDQDLRRRMFEQTRAFFDLPVEDKENVKANANSRGWTSTEYQTFDPKHSTRPDTVEGFWAWSPDVEEGTPEAELPYAGPNLWPDAKLVPGFREAMTVYMDTVIHVSHRVRKLVAEALQLSPEHFEQYFQHPLHQLRPLHYTATASNPDKGIFGFGAHSDWGFLTFLVTDDTPGLQIEYKGAWVDVAPVPDSIIVNVGDMLQFWSNDLFKSTRHRVVKPGKERYSCAFFVSADHDAQIECLPTCKGNGAKYEKISVSGYLERKYKQMMETKPEANDSTVLEG